MNSDRYDIRIRKGRNVLVDLEGFECPPGRITFLFGESGIGKSLTGKALFALLDPEDLSITINGASYETYTASDAARRMRASGFFVFQEPSSHLNPLMTLRDQLGEGNLAEGDRGAVLAQLWQGATNGAINNLLDVYPKPHRPSGGEKQRILCAMAFLRIDRAPERDGAAEGLFVFDEPTGSLDNRFRDVVLEMIAAAYRRRPITVLLITHDYSMISVVAEQWHDILDRVAFKEMVLTRDGQRQREFAPHTYTSWLKEQRTIQPLDAQMAGAAAILRVEPTIRVFGRTLTLTGPDRRTPCPLVVYPGTMAYVKAPSGMGKTTLAKMVMGLTRGEQFSATLSGIPLSERTHRSTWEREIWGRRATMVFQHADEALNLRARVREVFHGLPGMRISREALGTLVLEFFGGDLDEGFLGRRVGSLSGGQKQRLNVLRSMLLQTDLLILDEPLNGLDFASMQRVIALVRERLSRGQGILVISHNEEIFDALIPAEQVYYLAPGEPAPSASA